MAGTSTAATTTPDGASTSSRYQAALGTALQPACIVAPSAPSAANAIGAAASHAGGGGNGRGRSGRRPRATRLPKPGATVTLPPTLPVSATGRPAWLATVLIARPRSAWTPISAEPGPMVATAVGVVIASVGDSSPSRLRSVPSSITARAGVTVARTRCGP